MEGSFDYQRWTAPELVRAEHTANKFLSQNQMAIWQAFARQGAVLGKLVELLRTDELTLEERLDCFARIAEVSRGVQDCANGFFELGSQPLVARVLAKAELP